MVTMEVVVTSDSSAESWSAAVWNPLTGSSLKTYKNGAALGAHCLQVLNASYLLGADVAKPHLHIWPLNSQATVPNLRLTTPGKVTALACTPNGAYITAAVSEKIFIWQTSTGKLLRTLGRHYQAVTCLKFSQDGSTFASGGDEGSVYVWSLTRVINNHDQAAPTHSFSHHSLPVKDMYLGNFGAKCKLITVSVDRTARIYDANAGTTQLVLVLDVGLSSLCVDIIESNLFIGCTNGAIRQFNLKEPPRGNEHHLPSEKNGGIFFKGHSSQITSLAVSTDCRTLLSGSQDGSVHLWDIASRQIFQTITHKGPITTAMFVPHYANFGAAIFQPKVLVRPLQRITDEAGKDDVIEIISQNSDKALLDIDEFLESNAHSEGNNDGDGMKLTEARSEIERLQKINSEMYEFAIKYMMTKPEVKNLD